MFDNICKFLAETFPRDFATWLLGEPISSKNWVETPSFSEAQDGFILKV
jgi:predicted transposase YdaD